VQPDPPAPPHASPAPAAPAALPAHPEEAQGGQLPFFTGPNVDQIRYWNEQAGPRWVAREAQLTTQIRPLGQRAIDRAGLAPGQRALDVGCGAGETTREIARRVGPTGRVTGPDVCAQLLARAREVSAAEALDHIEFELADAQIAELPEGHYDVLFSRFGVMFFSDPEAAFRNLRRALRAGGRLSFVCWRALDENPWIHLPLRVVASHVTIERPSSPHAPGPFALADAERLRGILERAGFAELAIEPLDELLTLAGGAALDEAIPMLLDLGPIAAVMASAADELRARVVASLREALAPHATPDGLRLRGGAWLVSGIAGG